MAVLVSKTTGNLSASTSWYLGKAQNLPTVWTGTLSHVTPDSTARYSNYFTPSNAADIATGVMLINNYHNGTGSTVLTVDLMEGATVRATATANRTYAYDANSFPEYGCFVMKFQTPYTYGNTTANTWRYRFTATNGSVCYLVTQGGTLAFVELTDATQAPGSGDTLCMGGSFATAGTIDTYPVITVDASVTLGSATLPSIMISGCSKFTWGTSQAASYTITCNEGGHIRFFSSSPADYSFEMGTAANPLTSSYIQTVTMTNGTASNKADFIIMSSLLSAPRISIVGNYAFNSTAITNFKSTIATDIGVGGTSLVFTEDVGLRAGGGDLLSLGSTTAVRNAELVTTSAYNSATKTATISATVKAHAAGGNVYLMSSNAVLASSSTSYDSRFTAPSSNVSQSKNVYAYMYNVEMVGVACQSGFLYANRSSQFSYLKCRGCVTQNSTFTLYFSQTSTAYRNVYHYKAGILGSTGASYKENYFIGDYNTANIGLNFNGALNYVMDDCECDSFLLDIATTGSRFTGCKFYACEPSGSTGNLRMNGSGKGTIFENCDIGVPVASSTYDIIYGASSFLLDFAFIRCNFGKTVFLEPTNLHYMTRDSLIRFQNINADSTDNRIYKPAGSITTTGTGLTDTTVRTAGTNALKLSANGNTLLTSDDTLQHSIVKSVKGNSNVVWYGYMRKNATYGSTDLPKVTITSQDGNINTSATMTDVDDTWELFTVAGQVGAGNTYIELTIEAPANVSGGAAYFADMQLIIGDITSGVATGFKVGTIWREGEPTADETLGGTVDATFLENAVWNATASSHVAAGSTGKKLTDTKNDTGLIPAIL